MSQAGIANFNNSGLGFIQTINGDTGSITGHTVTIFANQATNNSGATVKFVNSGTVSTFNVTDSIENTFIGSGAGNLTYTGTTNTALGKTVLIALTNGTTNTCIGAGSGVFITSGSGNTCIGSGSGFRITTGLGNTCLGTGTSCSATGNSNIVIGPNSGTSITTTESDNILINNGGVLGESGAIRIGSPTGAPSAQTTCYIAGIKGVTVSNAQLVTINSSTGQLGVAGGSVVGTWTDVTGATQTLAVGNGYITDRGGGVTYTLPSTASLGDIIEIVGKAGLATITPNANQQINIGSASGTVGVTGTAVATNAGDCIQLRCTTSGASTVWRAQNFVGNWTLT